VSYQVARREYRSIPDAKTGTEFLYRRAKLTPAYDGTSGQNSGGAGRPEESLAVIRETLSRKCAKKFRVAASIGGGSGRGQVRQNQGEGDYFMGWIGGRDSVRTGDLVVANDADSDMT
jgi:hypothetical protein